MNGLDGGYRERIFSRGIQVGSLGQGYFTPYHVLVSLLANDCFTALEYPLDRVGCRRSTERYRLVRLGRIALAAQTVQRYRRHRINLEGLGYRIARAGCRSCRVGYNLQRELRFGSQTADGCKMQRINRMRTIRRDSNRRCQQLRLACYVVVNRCSRIRRERQRCRLLVVTLADNIHIAYRRFLVDNK